MAQNRVAVADSSNTEDTVIEEPPEPAASVEKILASFFRYASNSGMMPGMQKRGVKRTVMVALAVLANVCIYTETLCTAVMFMRLPITLDADTTLLVVAFFYHSYCASVHSLLLWFSCSGKLSSFLLDVDTMVTASRALPQLEAAISKRLTQYKSLFRKLSATFTVTYLLNSGMGMALILMAPNQAPFAFNIRIAMLGTAGSDHLPPISQAPWGQVAGQVAAALWWSYKSLSWTFGFFTFFVFTFILTHLSMGFCSGLTAHIRESKGLTGETASAYRLFYLRIMDVVESADSIFRLYLGATFLFSLVAIMFNINALIDTSKVDVLVTSVFTVWIGSSFLLLGLPVIVSGRILTLAKKPLDVLQRQEVTEKSFNELVVLLQVVNSNSSGITCAGMFTIDYSLIPSLTGLLLTYFILIVQTRQSTDCLGGLARNSSTFGSL